MAYLGFHYGGGGVNFFFENVRGYEWRKAPCSAWRSYAFVREVRGYAPPRKKIKWRNLERFREYFAKIFFGGGHNFRKVVFAK